MESDQVYCVSSKAFIVLKYNNQLIDVAPLGWIYACFTCVMVDLNFSFTKNTP